MAQKTRFGSTLVMLPLAAAFGLVACDTSASDVSDPTTSESALGARDDAAGGAAADEAAGGAPAEEAGPERPRPPAGGAPADGEARRGRDHAEDDADDSDDDVDEAADEGERGERPRRGEGAGHAEGDDGDCDRPEGEGGRCAPEVFEACRRVAHAEGEACVAEGGTREACAVAMGRAGRACLVAECGPPADGDGEGEGEGGRCAPEVFEACRRVAHAEGEACVAEGGTREACAVAMGRAGRACVEAECGPPPEGADGREPPPPPPR